MRTIKQADYTERFNTNGEYIYKTAKNIMIEREKEKKHKENNLQNEFKKLRLTTNAFSDFIPKGLKVRDELYDTSGTIYHSIGKNDFEK